MICPFKIETKLKIKWQSMQVKQLKNVKLELNVLQSPLMRKELKSLICNKCGNHQMERLETFLMELFSENLLLFQIFQDWFLDGWNQLLSGDTLTVTSINVKTLLQWNLEKLKLFLHQVMAVLQPNIWFITLKVQAATWECSIQKNLFNHLQDHVSNMHWAEVIL